MMQTDKEDKLVLSRAEDAVSLAEKNYQVKTVGFLNPAQRVLIEKNIYIPDNLSVTFEGGYDGAERTIMVCVPEYADFEIGAILKAIRLKGRNVSALTHRDYLGSLMGLGITRENIGDILCTQDGAVIFVKSDIADYILLNLDKVGRCGIKTEICGLSDIDIPKPKTREICGTVSSLRLDSVLSLAAGISRGRAAELIGQGAISLNWEVCESVSEKLCEGDLISARGLGRMRLEKVGGLTRKGRIGVTIVRFE